MPELLDSDAGTPAEIAASLLDLRWFNRWFGGVPTVRTLIHDVVDASRSSEVSLLEIASGDGYLPRLIRDEFSCQGVRLNFVLLDRSANHLPSNDTMPKIAGDALNLPFPESTFDLVSTSLFVHHLAPNQVLAFVKEALRVCRTAVLLHDLIRHPLHLALAYAGLPLYRSRITRNDAPASVFQAYTVDEMRSFFQRAGAAEVDIKTHYLFRMGVIAWKRKRL